MWLGGFFTLPFGGFKMRRFTTLSLVVAAGLIAGTAGADILWTGAVDGDITNDANYDFSGSALTTETFD